MNALKYFLKPKLKYKLSICVIIKDENDYLEEWLKYYLLIGVEHFYIYDNESEIAIIDTLKELGLDHCATVREIKGHSQQMNAYNDCVKRFGATSEWIAFVDIDEFIVPKVYPHNLPDFLEDYKEYGGLISTGFVFGSNGHKKRTNQPQLESFTLRSDETFYTNRHTKCIVQPKFVTRCDNPHYFYYKKGKFAVNENFELVANAFSDVSANKIQINHYYCRSEEEYLIKIDRGSGDSIRIRKMEDFNRHNDASNRVKDTTILEIIKTKMLDKSKKELV